MCMKIKNKDKSVPFANPVIRWGLRESQRNDYGRETNGYCASSRRTIGASSVQKPRYGERSVTVRSLSCPLRLH